MEYDAEYIFLNGGFSVRSSEFFGLLSHSRNVVSALVAASLIE